MASTTWSGGAEHDADDDQPGQRERREADPARPQPGQLGRSAGGGPAASAAAGPRRAAGPAAGRPRRQRPRQPAPARPAPASSSARSPSASASRSASRCRLPPLAPVVAAGADAHPAQPEQPVDHVRGQVHAAHPVPGHRQHLRAEQAVPQVDPLGGDPVPGGAVAHDAGRMARPANAEAPVVAQPVRRAEEQQADQHRQQPERSVTGRTIEAARAQPLPARVGRPRAVPGHAAAFAVLSAAVTSRRPACAPVATVSSSSSRSAVARSSPRMCTGPPPTPWWRSRWPGRTAARRTSGGCRWSGSG